VSILEPVINPFFEDALVLTRILALAFETPSWPLTLGQPKSSPVPTSMEVHPRLEHKELSGFRRHLPKIPLSFISRAPLLFQEDVSMLQLLLEKTESLLTLS
jgi:hypothetical protein